MIIFVLLLFLLNLPISGPGVAPTPSPVPSPSPTLIPSGPVFYAAVNGSPSGRGTFASPWDLQTAYNANIPCGATLYRRGGLYPGKYTANLKGCSDANPITVRNYPGEWARFDSFSRTTLARPLDATPTKNATIVLTQNMNWPTGTTVQIGTESLLLWLKQPDGVTWTGCERVGAVTAHPAGEVVWDKRDALVIKGQYTHYYDGEWMDSAPLRSWNQYQGGAYPSIGIKLVDSSVGIRIINPVLHDLAIGVFLGAEAKGAEIYGAHCFNIGWVDYDRGHGQCVYTLNEPGYPIKRIRNLIVNNGFDGGLKAYSESQQASGYLFEDIISFNAGVLSTHPGNFGNNGQPLDPRMRYDNLFIGTGHRDHPSNDVTMRRLYLYHSPNTLIEGSNLGIGYQGRDIKRFELTDSYIIGGNNAFSAKNIKSGKITGNTFFAAASVPVPGAFSLVADAVLETGFQVEWDRNKYFELLPLYDNRPYGFRFSVGGVSGVGCEGGSLLKFDEQCSPPQGSWRKLSNFDANSTYAHAAPNVNIPFVINNEYDPNLANVGAFNFQNLPTITLSVPFNPGDRVAFYPAESGGRAGAIFQTVIVSAARTISLPTSGWPVASPIGLNWTPASVSPRFLAGVIKRVP